MSNVPVLFYTIPKYASVLVTHQVMRAILKATGGVIQSCGNSWRVRVRPVQKGMFVISLQQLNAT